MNQIKVCWPLLNSILQQHVTGKKCNFSSEQINAMDADTVYYLLCEHRLEFIAYPLLNKILAAEHLLLQRIKARCLQRTQRTLSMRTHLIQLISLFEKEGIPYIVLKGQPLNQLLYGTEHIRVSNDIDILIAPEHILCIHEQLIKNGFNLLEKDQNEWMTTREWFWRFSKDLVYIHESGFCFELHWRVTRAQYISQHEAFQPFSSSSIILHGRTIPILPSEQHFLYLCIHGAFHYWNRLQWLIDIAVFWQRVPLQWSRIVQLAQETYTIRILLETSHLLKEWFEIELPPIPYSIMDRLWLKYHHRYVYKNWFQESPVNYRGLEFLSSLFLIPKLKYKLHFFILSLSTNSYSKEQMTRFPKRHTWLILSISLCKTGLKYMKQWSHIRQ